MVTTSTFIAYIDESGDEGFRFDAGSSKWFVLSAIVLRRANECSQVKLVDEVRTRINMERRIDERFSNKKPLHFRDLRHEQRKFYARCISQADLQIVSILINKPELTKNEDLIGGFRLYFYTVRLLIERLSWYCRDHQTTEDRGDGSVDLIFSNRASMDYDELRSYIETLDANRSALNYHAEPDIVRSSQIATFTHGKRMGLQIADAVASSFFYAVEPSAYGLTEDGYARLLLPRAYRHQCRLWGYGIKIVPCPTDERRQRREIFPFGVKNQ